MASSTFPRHATTVAWDDSKVCNFCKTGAPFVSHVSGMQNGIQHRALFQRAHGRFFQYSVSVGNLAQLGRCLVESSGGGHISCGIRGFREYYLDLLSWDWTLFAFVEIPSFSSLERAMMVAGFVCTRHSVFKELFESSGHVVVVAS